MTEQYLSRHEKSAVDLSTADWNRLDDAVQRFESAWSGGKRPNLDQFLPDAGDEYLPCLVELIHIDMEYLFKSGQQARIEHYLKEYPLLSKHRHAVAKLVFWEWRMRRLPARPETVREYTRRFPDLADELRRRLTDSPDNELLAEASKVSVKQLAKTLDSGPFLTDDQKTQLKKALQRATPQITRFTEALVRRDWLTEFQAEELLAGRAAELELGPYILLDELGQGGMGTVYKARHRVMKRLVAVKVIRKGLLSYKDQMSRFQQEIEAAAQLSHPNIVIAYDAGQAGDQHFFAMEYVDGFDLSKILKQQGALPVHKACDYIRQTARGLQHAHEKGMVHRDIKPSNLLVTGSVENPIVKILDMGLARFQSDGKARLTKLGEIMGTPDYIAPEQSLDAGRADIRADIYSLGCTLYHLLVGKPPFPGGNLADKLMHHRQTLPPKPSSTITLPRGLDEILAKMMAKKPAARFQTPSEVVQALTPFCALPKAVPIEKPTVPVHAESSAETVLMSPPVAMPMTAKAVPVKRTRRLRFVIGACVVGLGVAFAVLLVVTLWLFRNPTFNQPPQQLPKEFTNSIGMKLVWIPPGKFVMGPSRAELKHLRPQEKAHAIQHERIITDGFHMGVYEVTQQQYDRVMGKTKGGNSDPNQPAGGMLWSEAREFCAKLSALPSEMKAGRAYRLPTSAEWEYACRAGTSTVYFFGDNPKDLGKYAWHKKNSGKKIHKVGLLKPNPWGLCDILGNAGEFCQESIFAPHGGAKDRADGMTSHYRGGHIMQASDCCRCAFLGAVGSATGKAETLGFRVVCEVNRPPRAVVNSLDMSMVYIPPGKFMMGSSAAEIKQLKQEFPSGWAMANWEANEGPQHSVEITKPFFMATHEVTVGQFRAFVTATGYQTDGEKNGTGAYRIFPNGKAKQDPESIWSKPGHGQSDNHPVVCVSWNDAVAYCEWLSKKEGKRYRLPTEAEWEYACRAGTSTRYSFGDDKKRLKSFGNVSDESLKTKWPTYPRSIENFNDGHPFTASVGQFAPNPWGLYDMHGNVWERCLDGLRQYEKAANPIRDPKGPLDGKRSLRGASWLQPAWHCRSAFRTYQIPEHNDVNVGFRVVCEVEDGS